MGNDLHFPEAYISYFRIDYFTWYFLKIGFDTSLNIFHNFAKLDLLNDVCNKFQNESFYIQSRRKKHFNIYCIICCIRIHHVFFLLPISLYYVTLIFFFQNIIQAVLIFFYQDELSRLFAKVTRLFAKVSRLFAIIIFFMKMSSVGFRNDNDIKSFKEKVKKKSIKIISQNLPN